MDDEEARIAGFKPGADWLGLRRRIALGSTADEARRYAAAAAAAAADRLSAFIAEDKRFNPAAGVPDAVPQSGMFQISEDEFITGRPTEVAEAIIDQCRTTGAGHFLAVLHWSAPLEEVQRAHEVFGREVIPLLRTASLSAG